ncbi:uncharacterized protein [Ptychodera flava]|uniref:uncharacterized protein n=1 Tax=Ptychodera flava TaxID=63121 RepID=UPI00396A5449
MRRNAPNNRRIGFQEWIGDVCRHPENRSENDFSVFVYSDFARTPLCVTVKRACSIRWLKRTAIDRLGLLPNAKSAITDPRLSLRKLVPRSGCPETLEEDRTIGDSDVSADDNLLLTFGERGLLGGGGGDDDRVAGEGDSEDKRVKREELHEHAYKLYRHKGLLLKRLDLSGHILNHLVQDGAITLEDYYHIYQPGMSPRMQIERLIDVLAVKDNDAYQTFLASLQHGHSDLVGILEVEEKFQRMSVTPPPPLPEGTPEQGLTSPRAQILRDAAGQGNISFLTSSTSRRLTETPLSPSMKKESQTPIESRANLLEKPTDNHSVTNYDPKPNHILPKSPQTAINQFQQNIHSSEDALMTSPATVSSTLTGFAQSEPQQSGGILDSPRALTSQSFKPLPSHALAQATQANDSRTTSTAPSVRPPPPPYRYTLHKSPLWNMSESPPRYPYPGQVYHAPREESLGQPSESSAGRPPDGTVGDDMDATHATEDYYELHNPLPIFTSYSVYRQMQHNDVRNVNQQSAHQVQTQRATPYESQRHGSNSDNTMRAYESAYSYMEDADAMILDTDEANPPFRRRSYPHYGPQDSLYFSTAREYDTTILDPGCEKYPEATTESNKSAQATRLCIDDTPTQPTSSMIASLADLSATPSLRTAEPTRAIRVAQSVPVVRRRREREVYLSQSAGTESLYQNKVENGPPCHITTPITTRSNMFPPVPPTTTSDYTHPESLMVSCPEGAQSVRERGTPRMGVRAINSTPSLSQSPEMMDTSSPQRVRSFEGMHRLATCLPPSSVLSRGRSLTRRTHGRPWRQAQTPPPPKREPVTVRRRLAVTPPPTRASTPHVGYRLYTALDEDASVKANAEHFFRKLYTEEYAWMAQLCPRRHIKDIYTDLKLSKREPHGRPENFESFDLGETLQRDLCGAGSNRILVEGDAGSGKSTMCLKLVFDWATDNPDAAIKSKIPILLRVRNIADSVKDSVLALFPKEYSDEFREEFWEYLQRQADEFVLIFDGVNEMADGTKSDLLDLYGNKSQCKSAMLITTQPPRKMCLNHSSDVIVHVKGFSWYHTVDFIRKFFPRNFTSAAELTRELGLPINAFEFNSMRSAPRQEYFQKLCISPLHISILCSVWEDLEAKFVPQKISDLYRVLVLCTVRRLAIKENIILHADDLERIPDVYYDALLHLGKVSLTYIQKNETRVKRSDLKHNNNIVIQLGLLVREFGQYTVDRGMNFVPFHRSFFDFLAALYVYDAIRCNPLHDNSQVCRQLLRNVHCHQVCVFLVELLGRANLAHHFFAGFRRIDSLDTIFEYLNLTKASERFAALIAPLLPKSLTIHKQNWPVWKQHILCHLLRQDNASLKYLQINDPLSYIVPELWAALQQNRSVTSVNLEEFSLNTTPFEKAGLELVAHTLRNKWTLKVLKLQVTLSYHDSKDIFPIQSPEAEAVSVENLQLMVDCIRVSTIEHLYIFPCFGSKFSQMHMSVISEVLKQNPRLLSLNIGGHDYFCDSGIPSLYQNGLKFNSKLQSLNLSFCNLGEEDPAWVSVCGPILEPVFYDFTGAAVIAHIMRQCIHLSQVNVSQCKLTPQGAHYLADAMRQNQSVTSLDLSYNSLGYVGITEFGHVLRVNNTLIELQLNRIGFDEQSIIMFCDSLARNRGLKKLHLKECGVWGRALVVPLVNALCHKTDLELLDVSLNAIGDDGIVILTDVLQNSTRMKHLDLSVNKISDISIQSLAQGLLAMPQLQALLLQLNDITSRGARVIASLLPRMAQLRRLDLEKNKIGDKGVTWVAKSLKNHPNLKVVNLCDNDIGNSGAKSMADVLINNAVITHLKLCGDVKQTNYIDNEGAWSISRLLSQTER